MTHPGRIERLPIPFLCQGDHQSLRHTTKGTSLVRAVKADPFISNQELLAQCGLCCGIQTLTRWLKSQGIQYVTALRRPKLTEEHAAARLKFAQDHLLKPKEWWHHVVFSDESTVQCGEGEKQKCVFCQKLSYINLHFHRFLLIYYKGKDFIPSMSKLAASQPVMGICFGSLSIKDIGLNYIPLKETLYQSEGGVTARRSLEVLKEALPEILEPGMFFIQDNAPTHMAAGNQDLLEEWTPEHGVSVIKWPAYSPDLNPIENLWKLLKNGICEARPNLSDLPKTDQSKQELIDTAVKVWEELKEKVLDAEMNSMPNRIRAVVEAEGWYSKY